jgi:protein O-GlcNAc transferase
MICFDNSRGLSKVYNLAINNVLSEATSYSSSHNRREVIVFVHDDVWIDDAQIGEHLNRGLQEFDVIGVAGSVHRLPGQPGWAFLDTELRLNRGAMSGMIGHGEGPCGELSFYGRWYQPCELLDGVFLAVTKDTLQASGLLFDPTFDFDFYDMDFCRTARNLGLRLGTWPVAITHQSQNSFGDAWKKRYASYLQKWGD